MVEEGGEYICSNDSVGCMSDDDDIQIYTAIPSSSSSIPHFVVIHKRDKQGVMQDVDAVIYRQGPWLAVEGNLYKLDNYRERSNSTTARDPTEFDVPTPTISLAIVTGFTYAQHHIFSRRRRRFDVAEEEEDQQPHDDDDIFWIDNDNAGLDGTSRPLLVTPQLIVIQRWITTKQAKMRFNIRLALAMGLHPRLGAASSMMLASDDVMRMVVLKMKIM